MSPATTTTGSGASTSTAAVSRPLAAPKGFDPKGRAGSPASSIPTSMARALSGLRILDPQGDSHTAIHPDYLKLSRRAPITGAANYGELILLIPGPYREYLSSYLREAMKARRQLAGVKGQLSSLIEHKRTGKIPTWMNMKAPSLQTVKGFMTEVEGVAKPFEAAHLAFQAAVLDRAIEVKKNEVAYLSAHCCLRVENTEVMDTGSADRWEESVLYKSIVSALTSRFDELFKEAKVPVWGDPTGDSHGRPVFLGWKADEALSVEFGEVLSDFPHIFNRALQFVDDQILAEELKVEKKRALKDVVMKDVDEHITSSSIQSMVDKKVAVAVKSLSNKKGKGKVNQLSTSGIVNYLNSLTLSLEKSREEAIVFPGSEVRGLWPRKKDQTWEGLGCSEEGEEGRERACQGVSCGKEGRKGKSQQLSSGSLAASIKVAPFRYDSHRTYPDWLLKVPLPVASRFIVERIPLVVLESLRFRSAIHEIECSLPREIGLHLSAGLKYMIPNEINIELINDAWDDFVNRLRWNIYFKSQKDFFGEDNDDYDPDYSVKTSTAKMCDKFDRGLEYGILAGSRAIAKMVSNMPKEYNTSGQHNRAIAPPVAKLRDFLTSHQYVVLVTDKNLGCAVAPRSWIVEKTLKLLSNRADYLLIDRKQARAFLVQKLQGMESLAEIADQGIRYRMPHQLPSFFRSQMPDSVDVGLQNLPKFYVIPKIHKTPVSARPILPCHSVVQGPAGKFVSKLLKPIIKSAPGIIHGSKDLAIKLSKLSLPYVKFDTEGRAKKLFLISGDVVAFYPHVDVQKAHAIAIMYLERYLAEQELELDEGVMKDAYYLRLFRLALSLADDNLLCQFDGKFYQQARGLAMGVACSPDLANLYGLYFEEKSGILSHPDVPLYGRYIDDCLAAVYHYTEREALQLVADSVKFDNCTIEWTSSDSYMTFLDMTLFFDRNKVLQWKPFRKSMNHFERIPWISAHPLYVKKGTFVSELSRIAVLSSRFDDYADACREVADIYIARGFPPLLIASWLKDYYRVRWDARLKESVPTDADVLVLKSEYNASWDFFNVQTLADTMKTGWMEALRALSFGNVPADMHSGVIATKPRITRMTSLLREDPGDVVLSAHPSVVDESFNGEYLRLDKLGLLDRRFIVSKKRTTQLIDLTSTWRKIVLEHRDHQVVRMEQASIPQVARPQQPTTLDWWLTHRETREDPEPVIVPGFL